MKMMFGKSSPSEHIIDLQKYVYVVLFFDQHKSQGKHLPSDNIFHFKTHTKKKTNEYTAEHGQY